MCVHALCAARGEKTVPRRDDEKNFTSPRPFFYAGFFNGDGIFLPLLSVPRRRRGPKEKKTSRPETRVREPFRGFPRVLTMYINNARVCVHTLAFLGQGTATRKTAVRK